ncbi:MAG: hypothetical protein HY861_04625 [Chlamydiia bacterium]|nr:hypothetical protein [Chlamydiia bacterium]
MRPTIAIPYVSGDADGSLTGEVVRAVALSGIGEVCQGEAQYRFQARIVHAETQPIGYRRDRQEIRGESQKNLVAAEERRTVMVEVALYEGDSERIVSGPFRIEAYSEYDYVDGDSIQDLVFFNSRGKSEVVLPFSLGQLESIESAQEAAMRPLNVRLAKKMVDAVFAEW